MTYSTDDAEWEFYKSEAYLESLNEARHNMEFDMDEWSQKGGVKIRISEMETSHILNCMKKLKTNFKAYGNKYRVLSVLIMENELLKREFANFRKRLSSLEKSE